MVQDALADAQVLRSNFQQLVRCQEFQAAFQAELGHGDQAQSIVTAGCTGVGQVLGLAHVDGDVLTGRGVANNFALVNLFACGHNQGAALLGVEQTVSDGIAGIKADQGAAGTGGNGAAPFFVTIKNGVHDAFAVGVGQELAAVAKQAAAGHTELQTGTVVHHLHVHQDGLAGAQSGHNVALIGFRHVNHNALHGLHGLAVLLMGQNMRGADLQLVTFAAHGLNQDGQVHFATAHYAEGIVGGGIFHTQGNVLQQLALQAVTDLAAGDVLAFLAGKRGIVDGEGHLNGRIVDLNKGQRFNLAGVAHGVADGNIGQTGKGNNITGSGLLNGLAAVCLKVKQLGDAAGHVQVGVVPVANLNSLANLDDTVLHAANAHAAHKVVVVHAGNQHLHRGFGFTLRRGNGLQDGIKQRLQVGAVFGVGPIIAGGAVTAGAEHHRAVQLLVGSAQVYGGSAMVDEELKQSVIQDVTLLKLVGFKPIIVHGGGKEISKWVAKAGMEPEFINGLRKTDAPTMEIAEMVLGKVNKSLVQMVEKLGVNAVGISGKDGGLLKVNKKLSNGQDIGYVGEVKEVNPKILYDLLEKDFLPIICPVGLDDNYDTYNINADDAACAIARAVQAEKLAFLTDIEGVYKDPDDKSTLISELKISDAHKLIEDGYIGGGMLPKLNNCIDAIENGVSRVHILDGRIAHCLLLEIFTNRGIGTAILGDAEEKFYHE